MARACHVLRVFTRDDEGGNHLGVINDCTGIDTEGMQAVAADLGFSETTFVDWQPGEVPFVRIFTPTMELPFAGHPLVGTAWVMDVLGPAHVGALRCGIGEVGVRVEGDVVWIEVPLDQPVSYAGDHDLPHRAGMPPSVRAWVVEMPKEYLVLEYLDAETVAVLHPDFAVLAEIFGTLAFARHEDRVRARFFAPEAGVPEDPATGSAAVALAAALCAAGERFGSLVIDQGQEVGSPSRILLEWNPEVASVGGRVTRDEVRFLEA
jgi:trans-2,3-dihydro-3-hydroxyanthranilate isomerase